MPGRSALFVLFVSAALLVVLVLRSGESEDVQIDSRVLETTPSPSQTPTPTPYLKRIDVRSEETGRILLIWSNMPELVWPISGPISTYQNSNHSAGIDIDSFNNPQQLVVSIADGTVLYAGGNPCCSLGLHIEIKHELDGWNIYSVYAHLSSMSVKEGDLVVQGQRVGVVGCTGYCTGTHLHFEILVNGIRQQALHYLP